MDCMVTIFPNMYDPKKCKHDVCFELDHSSGHSKDRTGGLSVVPGVLNMVHGGAQRKMRASKIVEGCLGDEKHGQVLQIGDVKEMKFTENNIPPITDPLCLKVDRLLSVFNEKNCTKNDLKTALEINKLNADGNIKQLCD